MSKPSFQKGCLGISAGLGGCGCLLIVLPTIILVIIAFAVVFAGV